MKGSNAGQHHFNTNTQQYDMGQIMQSNRDDGFGTSSRIGTSVTNGNG